MLRAVVTADWHIGGMNSVFDDPLEYIVEEIHKPYKYAIENGIEHVIVPGDMSDVPYLSEHALIELVTILMTYDSSVKTYYVLGNHDVASVKKTSMDVLKVFADNGLFKNFKLFYNPSALKLDGIYTSFMPFPHFDVVPTKKPPLIIAHIETSGALGDNGRPLRSGHEDRIKRTPGDFIVTGHLHHHQYLKDKRILYPGSLFQKNFGEKLPKGFLDFQAKYVNGKLKIDYEFINSRPNFKLVNKLIESQEDWESLSTDKNVRYKITLGEGVVIPKNITTLYPNIVNFNGTSTKKKIQGSEESITVQNIPKFGPTTGLKKYLEDNDLNAQQIKAAKKLVKDAMNHLGIAA